MQRNLINKRVIKPPKNFRGTEIVGFLMDCEEIFKLKDAGEKNFLLDLSHVNKASMLSALIIYKVIEYSVNHSCFEEPVINLPWESEMGYALEKYGFTDLVLAFINEKNVKSEYEKLQINIGEGKSFIIAPHALIRHDKKSREEINRKYLPQIQKYYKNNPKAESMILLVFSEILLNFWEHAINDTESIIVAHGNTQNIEIACADTGNGIVTTLGGSLAKSDLRPEQILLESLKRGVTSKELTNHMGYGLWILDQITSLVKGRLHIYSQGAYYHNEFGNKQSGNCGYWQGTIVYISLGLQKPKTLVDIEPETSSEIKINWV
jgi:hypothetical protein